MSLLIGRVEWSKIQKGLKLNLDPSSHVYTNAQFLFLLSFKKDLLKSKRHSSQRPSEFWKFSWHLQLDESVPKIHQIKIGQFFTSPNNNVLSQNFTSCTVNYHQKPLKMACSTHDAWLVKTCMTIMLVAPIATMLMDTSMVCNFHCCTFTIASSYQCFFKIYCL